MVRYVEDLVTHARLGKRPFKDPEAAAQSIRSDRKEIFDFFSEYKEELEQAGIRPPKMSIEERVEVLEWISVVFEKVPTVVINQSIDVEDLSSVEEVNRLTRAMGCEGVAALVQLCPEGHKMNGEERVELLEALKSAKYIHTEKYTLGAEEGEEGRFMLGLREESGKKSFLSSAVARAKKLRGR